MAELKREYVVPLRRKTRFAPKWRRSKKAIAVLKDFIRQHMKTQDVIVCRELNELIWENGSKNPPGKISVVAFKTSIKGEEKTLVNLSNIGVEKQKELYESSEQQGQTATAQAAAMAQQNTQEQSQEAEVTEEKQNVEEDSSKEQSQEDKKGGNAQ